MTKDWPWGSHVMMDLMVGSASILIRRRGKVSRVECVVDEGVACDDDGGRELLFDEVGEAEADEAFWLLLLFLLLFFVRDDWVGSFGAALPRPPLLPCADGGVAFFFLLLLPLVLPAALLVLVPPMPAMGPLALAAAATDCAGVCACACAGGTSPLPLSLPAPGWREAAAAASASDERAVAASIRWNSPLLLLLLLLWLLSAVSPPSAADEEGEEEPAIGFIYVESRGERMQMKSNGQPGRSDQMTRDSTRSDEMGRLTYGMDGRNRM